MAHRAEINDCENCNEKDVCEASNMMNNYGLRCKMFSPYRPLTNADRIRSMTDEELADWLGVYCNGQTAQEAGKPCNSGMGSCEECWLDWLKQEVDDDNHSH